LETAKFFANFLSTFLFDSVFAAVYQQFFSRFARWRGLYYEASRSQLLSVSFQKRRWMPKDKAPRGLRYGNGVVLAFICHGNTASPKGR
jgi:hypothetical protein